MADQINILNNGIHDDVHLLTLMDRFAEEDGARLLQRYREQRIEEEPVLDALCCRRIEKRICADTFLILSKKVLRTAACLIAALLITASLGLCLSSEARAVMLRWITQKEEDAVTYTPVVQESDSEVFLQYEIRALPEEYTLLEELSSGLPGFLFYENPEGQQLSFFFQPPDGSGKLYMIPGEDEIQQVSVNGSPADLYIAAEEGKTSSIVWTDPDTGYLLLVKGVFSTDALLELAESVVCLEP